MFGHLVLVILVAIALSMVLHQNFLHFGIDQQMVSDGSTGNEIINLLNSLEQDKPHTNSDAIAAAAALENYTPKWSPIMFSQDYDSAYHIFSPEEVNLPNMLPIVFVVCDRDDTTKETLGSLQDAILNYTSLGLDTFVHFKIIISYDRPNDAIRKVVAEAGRSLYYALALQKLEMHRDHAIDNNYSVSFSEILHDVNGSSYFLPSYAHDMLEHRNFIRLKCHWFWIQRMLFHVNGFKRNIIFFEDDHRISPDSFAVLEQLIEWKDSGKETLLAVALSFNGRSFSQEYADPYVFDVIVADYTFPNAGYVLNQTFFHKLHAVSNHFFAIHTDWDNTIGHLCSLREISPPFMIIPQLSRVYHFSKSGLNMNEEWYKSMFETALYSTSLASEFNKTKSVIETRWKYETTAVPSEAHTKKALCSKGCTRCDLCQYCREKAQHYNCTIDASKVEGQ